MENQPTQPLPPQESPISTPPKPIVAPAQNPKSNLIPILLVLGLVVAIAIPVTFYFLSPKPQPVSPPSTPQPTPQAVAPTTVPFFLTVTEPTSTTVAVDGEVLVSGKTLASTTVAIVTDTDDVLIESDATGNFETTVVVGTKGGNLQVTAFGPDGEEKTLTYTISPSLGTTGLKLDSPVFAAAIAKNDNPKANENANKVDMAVLSAPKEKTAPAKTDPKVQAFLKTRTAPVEPKKIGAKALKELLASDSTASATASDSAKNKNNKNKTATASGALKSEKWHVKQASSGATLKRSAVSGVITDIAEGVITLGHQIQRDRVTTVYYNLATTISTKESKTASASALVVGARIAAVGEVSGNGLLAKRIHVIPGKATGVFTKNPVATKSSEIVTPTPASGSAKLPTPTPTVSTASPSATPKTATPTPSRTPTPTPTATP